jgi:hypothetical protein
MSEHIGISPAEEGWTVANDNETCLVVALNCYVRQQPLLVSSLAISHNCMARAQNGPKLAAPSLQSASLV